jgi:cytochrome c peroxidase
LIRIQIYSNFTGKININKLDNYANQAIPAYTTKDNTAGNAITDKGAT